MKKENGDKIQENKNEKKSQIITTKLKERPTLSSFKRYRYKKEFNKEDLKIEKNVIEFSLLQENIQNNQDTNKDNNNSQNNNDKVCVICMESVPFGERHFLHCGHCFHCKCIITWIKVGRARCPYCNQDVNPNCLEDNSSEVLSIFHLDFNNEDFQMADGFEELEEGESNQNRRRNRNRNRNNNGDLNYSILSRDFLLDVLLIILMIFCFIISVIKIVFISAKI